MHQDFGYKKLPSSHESNNLRKQTFQLVPVFLQAKVSTSRH
ncbi:hypothetical protein J699_01013 [Acinetobacter sp. 1000160]|nr:hypothetical protein J699_01013 [Acinetobacter sp. 1000160]